MDARNQQQKTSNFPDFDALRGQTVAQLKVKYRELFGDESRSNHKQFLVRRIAWRLQALAEGDLSERARERALSLARDADLRLRAPLGSSGMAMTAARSIPTRIARARPPGKCRAA